MRAVLDAAFPTLRPEQQAPLRDLMREQSRREEAFVAEHIAKRAPELQREYARNRARVALARKAEAEAAAERAGEGKADAVTDALMAGDFNEAGRLVMVRVDNLLLEDARDAAELEAQALLDAMEVGP